jgi:hypothetical protein
VTALLAVILVESVRAGIAGSGSAHSVVTAVAPIFVAPLALWLFASERYEVTLAVVLVYLGVGDGFVKLSTGSNLATLARDAFLYAITLGAVARLILRRTRVIAPPLVGFVLAWAAVCVMQIANPSDVSLGHSLAALRPHLEFVPLFFFGFFILRSERRLTGLLLLLVVVATANGIVSVIQSGLTPKQLGSWGPGYNGLELGTGGNGARVFHTAAGAAKVRPPGLGGTDGFGGLVGLVALPGLIVLFGSFRRVVTMGWLLIPATVAIMLGIITSQTRLDVVGSVVAVVAFLMLTVTSRRGLRALFLSLAFMFLGYTLISTFAAGSANRYSSIAPSKIFGTAFSARQGTMALVPTYITSFPLGAGIGSTGPGAGSSFGGSAASRGLNGESEFTFLLVETGLPGLLVILAFTVAVIRAGVLLRRCAVPRLQKPLMALTAVLIALTTTWFFGPDTATSPGAPFFWLTAGCLSFYYGEMRAGRLPMRPRRVRAALSNR